MSCCYWPFLGDSEKQPHRHSRWRRFSSLSGAFQNTFNFFSKWRVHPQEEPPRTEHTPDRLALRIQLIASMKVKADRARAAVAHRNAYYRRIVLRPDGLTRVAWDSGSLLVLGYTIFEIPYTLIFLRSSCEWDSRVIINLVVDSVFMCEIALNFFTGYYDDTEEFIMDPKLIAKRYLKGWLPIDFLSSLPVDRILCSAGLSLDDESVISSSPAVRGVKVLRMLKLARVLKFLRVLKTWEARSGSKVFSHAIRFLKFLSMMVMTAHMSACVWMLLIEVVQCGYDVTTDSTPEGTMSGHCTCIPQPALHRTDADHCQPWNWLVRYDPQLANDPGLASSKYIVSLYFTIVTLSTVGFGDIVPANDFERIYAVLLSLMGALLFAFCIGSISDLASQGNKTEMALDECHRGLADFLRHKNLPPKIQQAARQQMLHSAKRAPHLVHHCLDSLPSTLKNRIIDKYMSDWIGDLDIFRNMDENFRSHLLSMCHPVLLHPDEFLFRSKESATAMYFLIKGELMMLDETEFELEPRDPKIIARYRRGDLVGEVGLFPDTCPFRTHSVKCKGPAPAELLELRRSDFHLTIKPLYPDIYQTIKDLAMARMVFQDNAAKACLTNLAIVSKRRTVALRRARDNLIATKRRVQRAFMSSDSIKGALLASSSLTNLHPPAPHDEPPVGSKGPALLHPLIKKSSSRSNNIMQAAGSSEAPEEKSATKGAEERARSLSWSSPDPPGLEPFRRSASEGARDSAAQHFDPPPQNGAHTLELPHGVSSETDDDLSPAHRKLPSQPASSPAAIDASSSWLLGGEDARQADSGDLDRRPSKKKELRSPPPPIQVGNRAPGGSLVSGDQTQASAAVAHRSPTAAARGLTPDPATRPMEAGHVEGGVSPVSSVTSARRGPKLAPLPPASPSQLGGGGGLREDGEAALLRALLQRVEEQGREERKGRAEILAALQRQATQVQRLESELGTVKASVAEISKANIALARDVFVVKGDVDEIKSSVSAHGEGDGNVEERLLRMYRYEIKDIHKEVQEHTEASFRSNRTLQSESSPKRLGGNAERHSTSESSNKLLQPHSEKPNSNLGLIRGPSYRRKSSEPDA